MITLATIQSSSLNEMITLVKIQSSSLNEMITLVKIQSVMVTQRMITLVTDPVSHGHSTDDTSGDDPRREKGRSSLQQIRS